MCISNYLIKSQIHTRILPNTANSDINSEYSFSPIRKTICQSNEFSKKPIKRKLKSVNYLWSIVQNERHRIILRWFANTLNTELASNGNV